jgi:hypothetical protein
MSSASRCRPHSATSRPDSAARGPLRCPRCGSPISRAPGTETIQWRCAAGDQYLTTRELIRALLALGWRPHLETR